MISLLLRNIELSRRFPLTSSAIVAACGVAVAFFLCQLVGNSLWPANSGFAIDGVGQI